MSPTIRPSLTIREAATALAVPDSYIIREVLPAIKTINHRALGPLIPEAELERWLAATSRRQPSAECVYFIACGTDGPIKIGYTARTPESRLAGLQTASPFLLEIIGTIPATEQHERDLHKALIDLHIRGEWFHRTRLVLEVASCETIKHAIKVAKDRR